MSDGKGRITSALAAIVTARITPILAGAGAAAAVLAVSYVRAPVQPGADPAQQAEAAYGALLDQLRGAAPAAESPAAEQGRPGGEAAQAGSGVKLVRDLFHPMSQGASGGLAYRLRRGAGGAAASLRLQGVFIDGEARHAVIGGKIVTVGDTVAGYKVVEITPEAVLLEGKNSKVTLELGDRS